MRQHVRLGERVGMRGHPGDVRSPHHPLQPPVHCPGLQQGGESGGMRSPRQQRRLRALERPRGSSGPWHSRPHRGDTDLIPVHRLHEMSVHAGCGGVGRNAGWPHYPTQHHFHLGSPQDAALRVEGLPVHERVRTGRWPASETLQCHVEVMMSIGS